uniref:ShTK domain protein n=1 Tax=Panagrellus redivivus TaxID=6233 RepID=A0A7E4VH69_PANRE
MRARQWISNQQQQEANTVVFAPAVPQQPSLSPAVPQPFRPSQYTCMDIGCLCSYMRGLSGPGGQCTLQNGQPMRQAIRREYRQLSDNERNRFHAALQQLKRSGEYDRLSAQHREVGTASGAHSGPGFLPWHREYLKRIEIALRMIDPSVAMPYWDSVMDFYLPNPRDSILWSPLFLGENDASGAVVNGPFGGWGTLEGHAHIQRALGNEGRLFNESDIQNVLRQTEIQNILAYTAPQNGCPYPTNYGALEYSHASVHLWVGGDMRPPAQSANDPTFFVHHSFVDYIWEMWRQSRQSRWTREQAYPQDYVYCANQQHFSNANMRPFAISNRDGLSNAYTDNMYRYAPRPTCSHQNPGACNSNYLFCDTRFNYAHCVSKVKQGGNCRGFEGLDACWNGFCNNGRCIPGQMPMATTPPPPQPNAVRAPAQNPLRNNAANTTISTGPAMCLNDDPCCPIWASRQECRSNTNYMSRYCKRSCGYCRAPIDRRQGCFNRHNNCAYFRNQGECTRRRQWMSENCRAACGWCNMSPSQLCLSVARFSRM